LTGPSFARRRCWL